MNKKKLKQQLKNALFDLDVARNQIKNKDDYIKEAGMECADRNELFFKNTALTGQVFRLNKEIRCLKKHAEIDESTIKSAESALGYWRTKEMNNAEFMALVLTDVAKS